ncbi:MAG: aminotransferase class V-fold PLP-dependent enzyme [Cyclobacteriaceae bacterium]
MLTDDSVREERKISDLESYFSVFRNGIIGIHEVFSSSEYPSLPMVYADWTASGKCYAPIEERMISEYMPLIANTHTEATYCSSFTTSAYEDARNRIKRHVNAFDDDILIASGSGMTDVVNKLQRILGLRIPEQFKNLVQQPEEERPIVFVSHMEHHSNHTSWLETLCEVVVVPPDEEGKVSVENFKKAVELSAVERPKIASITACSNVTGIINPIHEIARLIHRYDGYCFVDFACSAPYVDINMHPENPEERLDVIFFSPHKFLGGPGASGVLIFNASLYRNGIPDVSGGGTVDWTNPWGGRKYISDIESREDGGTPPILQTIKAALAIDLKEEMGVSNIRMRDEELMSILWKGLFELPGLEILAKDHRDRLGILSFLINGMHYNEVVKKLNDRYGIQSRGGCSCAGTYGHFLLDVSPVRSKQITDLIDEGDDSLKPGWVRISVHPTMTNDEVEFIVDAIRTIAAE